MDKAREVKEFPDWVSIDLELDDDHHDIEILHRMVLDGLDNTRVINGPHHDRSTAWPVYEVEGPRAEILTVIVRQHMLTVKWLGKDGPEPVLEPGLLRDLNGELEEAIRLQLGYVVYTGDGVTDVQPQDELANLARTLDGLADLNPTDDLKAVNGELEVIAETLREIARGMST